MNTKEAMIILLKNLEEEKELLSSTDIGITNIKYGELIQELETRNLIYGTKIIRSGDDNRIDTIISKDSRITSLGRMYIADNVKWKIVR